MASPKSPVAGSRCGCRRLHPDVVRLRDDSASAHTAVSGLKHSTASRERCHGQGDVEADRDALPLLDLGTKLWRASLPPRARPALMGAEYAQDQAAAADCDHFSA
jgi:hypothetical protein